MGMQGRFSSWAPGTLWEGVFTFGKDIAPLGAYSLILGKIINDVGGSDIFGRIAALSSVSGSL